MEKTYIYFVKLVKQLNNKFKDYCFNYDYELGVIDVIDKYDRLADSILFKNNKFSYDYLGGLDQGLDIIFAIEEYLRDNPYNFN